ncbi:MAG: hypothetical protein L3K03_08235 [Thermoplasmata archaeon]|nr:hypothetical protein [Thermoplasmata archaeon]
MSSASGSYSSRPLGVAIIAVLIGLFGLVELIVGVFLLIIGAGFALVGASTDFGVLYFHSILISGLVLFLLGIVLLVIARSLWELEMWALALALIVLIVLLVLNLASGTYLSLHTVVEAILIVYLVAVSRHFR